MTSDLFISYAWTSDEHREWVRLLASTLKAIGFDVLVDVDVDYGDGLNGFMRRATECRHVLLIVDDNYIDRADNRPTSGVGIETKWVSEAHASKPSTWLSVLFKDNPDCRLPRWLAHHDPKGLSFNADPAAQDCPGSVQVEELWRWLEDLPANRDHAVGLARLRERAKELEVIDRQRDPASWANPAIEDEIHFEYRKAPGESYSIGCGERSFVLQVSQCGADSVYVYKDPIHAVGLNRSKSTTISELAAQLTPGRNIVLETGEQAILQNSSGALCLVDLIGCQVELTEPVYVPASITFRYRILLDS